MREDYWPRDNIDFYQIMDENNIITLNTNGELSNQFYLYSQYYSEAATIIAKRSIESASIRDLDFYFFSLAYLYRHSIELILKAIAFQHIVDDKNRIDFMRDTRHNLLKLLERVKDYIDLENIEINNSYRWLTKLFQDMDDIDRESDCFRYPFRVYHSKERWDRRKSYHLRLFFNEQTHIDLIEFANKMIVAREILTSYYDITQPPDSYKEYKPIFIEEGGAYYAQSVIYSYNRATFRIHVSSFHETAGIIGKVIKENISKNKHLVLPMCYLYRNSVELALKQIIFEQSTYEQQQAIKIMKDKGHSIQGLWNSAKGEIKQHCSFESEYQVLNDIDKYVKILHRLDLKSDTFRYPINDVLEPHFKTDTVIDIESIIMFFEEFIVFLNSACGMMEAHNEYLAEMQAEYAQYYENY